MIIQPPYKNTHFIADLLMRKRIDMRDIKIDLLHDNNQLLYDPKPFRDHYRQRLGIIIFILLVFVSALYVIFYIFDPKSMDNQGKTSTSIIVMRHSIRTDQECTKDMNLTDNADYCHALSQINNEMRIFDPSIRNCYLIEHALNEIDIPNINIIVTSPFLRCITTAAVALRYYHQLNSNKDITSIIIDERVSETWNAVKKDNNGSTENIQFIDAEQRNNIWNIVGIDEDTIENKISSVQFQINQSLDKRFEAILDAMDGYSKMKENVLIITHDVWITRMMDMCLGNSTNIIPRHVPETTILRIDYDGDCYLHFPQKECHPKEFMDRDDQITTAFGKFGSIKHLIHSSFKLLS